MLHEDLNQGSQLPGSSPTGTPRALPPSDKISVGRGAWQTHLERNQSVVVDTFQVGSGLLVLVI